MTSDLAEAYAHGHGKDVRTDGVRGPVPVRLGGHAFAAVARRGPFAAALVRVLTTVLAPRRWEPWNPFNDHRAYPSPRSIFLVDVWLVEAGRRWCVDPVRGTLCGPVAPPRPDGTARLELTRHPERLPAGYGSLASALAELEAGHLLAALAEAAAGAGLRMTTLDGGTHVEIGADAAPAADATARWWTRATAPRSSGPYPLGAAPDPRPLPGAVLASLLRAATEPPPGSPAHEAAALRHRLALSRVGDHRDGWYVPGAAGALGPAAPAPAPGTDGTRWGGAGGTGAAPGAAARAGSAPAASAMEQLRGGFTYPATQADFSGLHVGWVLSADLADVIRAGRRPGYHALLRAAGAVAQHVGSAAALAGLYCRPARSVYEARIEAASGAPAGDDFVYLLLLGRSRLRGFDYDLTTPDEETR